MPRFHSNIPAGAKEKIISSYSEKRRGAGGVMYPEVCEYRVNEKIVGYRYLNAGGILIEERGMKDGKRHGREFVWDDEISLAQIASSADRPVICTEELIAIN
jgi:hypothetical protein